MSKESEESRPINFRRRANEKKPLRANRFTSLIQKMYGILNDEQREILWNELPDADTVRLTENLPGISQNELTNLTAKAHRVFIRSLSPTQNKPHKETQEEK